jgi:hypothetical protein
MKLRPLLLVALVTFLQRRAQAESMQERDLAAGRAELQGFAHFGVTTAPFDVPTHKQAKGHAFVFLVSGRYVLSPLLSLELRAPFVLGSVAQPAGSYVDTAAFGNPQFGLRAELLRRALPQSALLLSSALEVGVPLASHAADWMPNRVLAIADGIEGRGHPEWFTPGVVPLTPSAAVRYWTAAWDLHAELRLPVLVRVSNADLPSAWADTRSLGLASIVAVGARYHLSRRLTLAAAGHVFFDVLPAVERLPGVSRLQDFERLSLEVHIGARATLALDLQTAIAGALGGHTFGGGLRARVR